MKVRALAGRAFKSDFAAHLFQQFGRDDQAEAGAAEAPAGRALRLHERLKQAPLRLVRNSNSSVGDLEPHQHVVAIFVHFARP